MYSLHIANPNETAPNFAVRACGDSQATAGSDRYTREDFAHWTFEYVESGEGHFSINGLKFRPRAGDLYVLQRGSSHDYYPHPRQPWRKRYIQVYGTLVEHLLRAYGLNQFYYGAQFQKPDLLRRLQERWLVGGRMDTSDVLAFHEFVLAIHQQYRHQETTSEAVRVMRQYLHDHVEQPFSLGQMAEHFELSKGHLIRRFRSESDCTPYEYLLRLRLDSAKWLLSFTSLPVTTIGRRLQFEDIQYFSAFFRKRTKSCPRDYRNSQNKG